MDEHIFFKLAEHYIVLFKFRWLSEIIQYVQLSTQLI